MCLKNRIYTLVVLLLVSLGAVAKSRRAEVKLTTTEGVIVVQLYNETPIHRNNFIAQVKRHTYDGVLFHRVINEFMIQGGDPLSKTAGPGEHLGEGDETNADWLPPEFRIPDIYHRRGVLAAAREGDDVNPEKKSSCQQFYIVTGKTFDDETLDRMQATISKRTKGGVVLTKEMRETYKSVGGTPHLDGSYTVFGEVIKGMDIVDHIQKVETNKEDRPLKDIRILKAKVSRKYKK